MQGLEELLSFASTYLSKKDCQSLKIAYEVAEKAHRGQKRISGEPYITHPIAVSLILARYYLDLQTLQAALLHDVLEDTTLTKAELQELFGEKVANLVDGVSKLKKIHFPSRAHEQAENLRKMMFSVAQDIRVLLIKLADRLHNMRTLSYMSLQKQKLKAQETLDIYAPIAHRLGMGVLREEFEQLGMKTLYPWRYKVLEAALEKYQLIFEKEHDEIYKMLKDKIDSQHISYQEFFSQSRDIPGIYYQMRKRRKTFQQSTQAFGFRLIVTSQEDCYRLLGVIHNLFRPVLSKFKDYIAIAKANGYQSLHTTVITPSGRPLQFQIRTLEMDATAQKGIAAHWVYKNEEHQGDKQSHRAYQWIQNVIDLQETSSSPIEFIENMKIDLNCEEVYVFDERSNIWILPRQSTAIDLAYAQSIEKGNRCVGVRIDGQMMPLSTTLHSGQKVDILTDKKASPNPNWLTFAISGKARAHIRSFLCNLQQQHALVLGEKLLEKELHFYGHSLETFKTFFTSLDKEKIFDQKNYQDLLEDIGMGRALSSSVVQKFCHIKPGSLEQEDRPVGIEGTEKYVLTYATCCYPIPFDSIVGLRLPNKGIIIHRRECSFLEKSQEEGSFSLKWQPDSKAVFTAAIFIRVKDHLGVLAAIADLISQGQANILSLTTSPCDLIYHEIEVIVEVRDTYHLEAVIKSLRSFEAVHHVERL